LKQGEKISNLENASQDLIYLPLNSCKRTLKRIYKRICKNKTSGASTLKHLLIILAFLTIKMAIFFLFLLANLLILMGRIIHGGVIKCVVSYFSPP
jgi:hypothetical protein